MTKLGMSKEQNQGQTVSLAKDMIRNECHSKAVIAAEILLLLLLLQKLLTFGGYSIC